MMTVEEKMESHMNYGLILCSSVLESKTQDNEVIHYTSLYTTSCTILTHGRNSDLLSGSQSIE